LSGLLDAFLESGDPQLFSALYQIFKFSAHLSLVDIDNSMFLEDIWLENEKHLLQLDLPNWLMFEMNTVMKEWLQPFVLREDKFLPQFGPGAVAEGSRDMDDAEKCRLLGHDHIIRYALSRHGIDSGRFLPGELEPAPINRRSTTVFVPKSIKTLRVISKESSALMWFEQAVARPLMDYIEADPYLGARINFAHQEVQMDLARRASIDRDLATVDLSSASDLISYDLVKRVFAGTSVLPLLVALRSRTTKLPSGREFALAKFAPMGSALAFPVETLIFACVCECAARHMDRDYGVTDFRYRVYGDDIICPTSHFGEVAFLLEQCGFRINQSKTFTGSHHFRESCGGEYVNGHDVTPMKISRKFSSDTTSLAKSPELFGNLVSLANTAYSYKFGTLRRYVIHLIQAAGVTPLFSDTLNEGIFSPFPTNYSSPHVYNRRRKNGERWQEREVKVHRIHTTRYRRSSVRRFRDGRVKVCLIRRDADDLRYFLWSIRTRVRIGPLLVSSVCTEREWMDTNLRGQWYATIGDPATLPDIHVGGSVTTLKKEWNVIHHSV